MCCVYLYYNMYSKYESTLSLGPFHWGQSSLLHRSIKMELASKWDSKFTSIMTSLLSPQVVPAQLKWCFFDYRPLVFLFVHILPLSSLSLFPVIIFSRKEKSLVIWSSSHSILGCTYYLTRTDIHSSTKILKWINLSLKNFQKLY